MFHLPFLEDTTPPPFYRGNLNPADRTKLDKWFIGLNSQQYYLKRFDEFDKAGKLHARWHWAAFFCTFGWLLYRKRYLDCIVYCVAGWSFIKVNIAVALAALEFMVIGFLPEIYQTWARVVVGGSVWLFWASMVARWADAYYYRMARREIADVLDLYPNHPDKQKSHLKQEGGTSVFGMSAAFAIFGVFLAIIVGQFVPIIATKQEQAVIFESHKAASIMQKRVEKIYELTQHCPTALPEPTQNTQVAMSVVTHIDGIKTDCAVVATVLGANYPVRYLNGETLVLYHTQDKNGQSIWRCQTSLNKKRHPKSCI